MVDDELITRGERRRRWSVEQKREIAAESLEPGVSSITVARRYGISSGLLHTWRRHLLEGSLGSGPLGYAGVFVYNAQGKMIGRIRLPEICANLCFGGPKRNQLFMTASQSVYMLQVNTQGAAPG